MPRHMIRSFMLMLVAGTLISVPASAQTDHFKSVGGYSDFGVVPAEVVKSHQAPHGSVPVSTQTDYSKSAGGYSVYLGVVPTEIVKGHAATHTEATMHGGAKARDSHHVMVSIIEERSGKQIADAVVEARVGEIGLSVTAKKLEPMVIAGRMTYGNFFPMSGAGPFQIDVEFRPSGQTKIHVLSKLPASPLVLRKR